MLKNIFIILSASCALIAGFHDYEPTWYTPSDANNLGGFRDLSTDEVKTYYSGLEGGQKGDTLLTSLQGILENGQKELAKSTSSTWTNYVLLDRDWVKDPLTDSEITSQKWKTDKVVCAPLYDTEFTFDTTASPGTKVNREHVYPKSYGFGNDSDSTFLPYAATDMHNLHMGEARNNQSGHNNYPYGNVTDKNSATAIKSSISGEVTGYLGVNKDNIPVYEPMDKDKGDIARSIFYMAARYHTYDASKDNCPSLKLSDKPTDIYTNKTTITADMTKDNPCEYGILTDLLSWNDSDPVDDHEIHRNNLCYNFVQNNRNPFIDYPSWAKIAFDATNTSGIDLAIAPSQVGSVTPTPEVTTHKVTFVTNCDTVIASISVKDGGLIAKPSDLVKDGYTFGGWFTTSEFDATSQWNFDVNTVTKDITLYAKWTENGPWYIQVYHSKYFYVIVVLALVGVSFIISYVASKKKKRSKGTTKVYNVGEEPKKTKKKSKK